MGMFVLNKNYKIYRDWNYNLDRGDKDIEQINQVMNFVDCMQSVIEKKHKITHTQIIDNVLKITKG